MKKGGGGGGNNEEERVNTLGEEEAKKEEAGAGVWMSGEKRRGKLMRMGFMYPGKGAGAGRLMIGTMTENSTGFTTEDTAWIITTVTIDMGAVPDEVRQLGEEMFQPTTNLRLDMTKKARRTQTWKGRKIVCLH